MSSGTGTTASGARQRPTTRLRGIRLLVADPDLGALLSSDEFAIARDEIVVPRLDIPAGRVRTSRPLFVETGFGAPFGALVLTGLLIGSLRLGRDSCAHLIGPGDVLDAGAVGDPDAITLAEHTLTAKSPTILALLDDHFLAACGRWPRLSVTIQRRLHTQARDAFMHQAIAQLPTVEDRLVAFFLAIAERWGSVGEDGTTIELPLTHELLGDLIGARRPTISLALKQLAAEGHVIREGKHRWLLAPDLRARLAAHSHRVTESADDMNLVADSLTS